MIVDRVFPGSPIPLPLHPLNDNRKFCRRLEASDRVSLHC
ncbi:hypothetical protein CKA32_004549 [Geitlerinema sp. FC II]|nr:hypothetical protein CKA32_004549 [Geitlerinema sp. FC II]